jgi:hypothetical protein
MTKVAILPVTTDQGDMAYRAIAGAKQSSGATAGAALDALTAQLSADETSTLIIVQSLRPDQHLYRSPTTAPGPIDEPLACGS